MKSQTCFFALTFSYLYSFALIFLLLLQIPSTVLPLPSIPLVAQTSINGSFAYQGVNISHPGLCNIHGDSFSYTETINLQENSRVIQTSSCPNHYSACQYGNCGKDVSVSMQRERTIKVPLFPHLAKLPKDFTCSLEDTGIALNGVAVRSITTGVRNGTVGTPSKCLPPRRKLTQQQVAQNAGVDWTYSVYGVGEVKTCSLMGENDAVQDCGDVVPQEGIYYDKCGGRADDDGIYHYKIAPSCLITQLQSRQAKETIIMPQGSDTAFIMMTNATKLVDLGQHSPQIGWAMDGFPIYGPRGPKGVRMAPCTPTSSVSTIHGKVQASRPSVPTSLDHAQDDYGAGFLNRGALCLDRCNGLHAELPEVDKFIYRYYMTGEDTSGECSSVVTNSGKCSSIQEKKCCISSTPSKKYAPYGPACLVGCEHGVDCESSGVPGTTALYYPSVSMHPDEVYEVEKEQQQAAEITVTENIEISSVNGPSPSDAQETLMYNEAVNQSALLTNAGGVEKTLFRFFQNRSLAILTTDARKALPSVGEPVKRSLTSDSSMLVSSDNTTKTTTTVATNNTFTSNHIQVELLPVTSRDAFIHDMALHRNESTFFFSLPSTITSAPKDGKAKGKSMNTVVNSLIYLTIEGHDLGSKPDDVVSVQLGGHPSNTLRWVSSTLVKAIFTNIPYVDATLSTYPTFTAQDVKIVTKGGEMTGPHLQPLTLIKSQSGRPVIIQVHITTNGLAPYAIATPTAGIGMAEPALNERVYWSNVYRGFSGMFRCKQDGTSLEMLVTKKERIYDILVLPLEFSEGTKKDVVMYIDAQQGQLVCITAPQETSLSYTTDTTHTSAVEMPLLGDNVEFVILAGMLEPTALALDDTGGFVYVVTRDGQLYEIKLVYLIELVTAKLDGAVFDATATYGKMANNAEVNLHTAEKLPKWIKYINTGINSVKRITGISILPTVNSMLPSDNLCPSDFEIEPWYRRRIILSNAARSSVILVSTSGLRPEELYVGGHSGDEQIIWPMSVVARYDVPSLYSYLGIVCNNFKAPFATFQIKLYLAEFLGKVWEQELNFPIPRSSVNSSWSLDIIRDLHENSTLLDVSRFTASLEIRSYFEYSRRFDPVTTFVETELSQPIPISMDGVGASKGGRLLNRESPIRFEAVG